MKIVKNAQWNVIMVDKANSGDEECEHVWVDSPLWTDGDASSEPFNMKSHICSKCKRKEILQLFKEYEEVEDSKSDYDLLKDSLNESTVEDGITSSKLDELIKQDG
jgi:hypothetical protein